MHFTCAYLHVSVFSLSHMAQSTHTVLLVYTLTKRHELNAHDLETLASLVCKKQSFCFSIVGSLLFYGIGSNVIALKHYTATND